MLVTGVRLNGGLNCPKGPTGKTLQGVIKIGFYS